MRAIEEWRIRRPSWFSSAVIDFAPGEGEGWSEIVDELLQQVDDALCLGAHDNFHIGQIKEKIGSLRVYFRIDDANPRC
jgi:hypothetical protein